MEKLVNESVKEFIEKFAKKSDEEILQLFDNRLDYQVEAATAIINIAIERGLIEMSDNLKKELNTDKDWYYEFGKKRKGPFMYSEIIRLINDETLSFDSLIWKRGYGEWQQLKDTEFVSFIPNHQPPPLTGNKVGNIFVWLLALSPIFSVMIVGTKVLYNSSWLYWIILNTILVILDGFKLKRAGYKSNILWGVIFVPVYLWKRATLTKQSKSYFWVWLIALFILSYY